MSSYDVVDVLRALPPRTPSRKIRLMVALATFPEDQYGWRTIRMPLLAYRAHMHPERVRATRKELAADKLLEFDAPAGRGKRGAYRLLIPKSQRHDAGVSETAKPQPLLAWVSRPETPAIPSVNPSDSGPKPQPHVAGAGLLGLNEKVSVRPGAAPNGAGPHGNTETQRTRDRILRDWEDGLITLAQKRDELEALKPKSKSAPRKRT